MTQLTRDSIVAMLTGMRQASCKAFSFHLLPVRRGKGDLFEPLIYVVIDETLSEVEGAASQFISEAFEQLPPEPRKSPEIQLALTGHLRDLFKLAQDHLASLQRNPFYLIDSNRKSQIRAEVDNLLKCYRDSLPHNQLDSSTAPQNKRGRKPKYDWPLATNRVCGRIYRGEITPAKQCEVEQAFADELQTGDEGPEPENCRVPARYVWEEMQREPKDNN